MLFLCGNCSCGNPEFLQLDTVSDLVNTRHWTNVGLMVAYRLRRWPNINPTLLQYLVFTEERHWSLLAPPHAGHGGASIRLIERHILTEQLIFWTFWTGIAYQSGHTVGQYFLYVVLLHVNVIRCWRKFYVVYLAGCLQDKSPYAPEANTLPIQTQHSPAIPLLFTSRCLSILITNVNLLDKAAATVRPC